MISEKDRFFWMAIRQALIMILGAIEDWLDLERSIIPRKKRGKVKKGSDANLI